MKNVMLILITSLITASVYCQDVKSNTVMVKSIETYGSFAAMRIKLHIVDENGVLTSKDLVKHNTKGIPVNMITIKNTLEKYLNLNYELISSTAVSFGWNGVFTIEHTYLFQEKPNQ